MDPWWFTVVHSLFFFTEDLCFRAVKGFNKMEEVFHFISYEEGYAEFSKKPKPKTTTKPKQTYVQITYAYYKILSLQRSFRSEALCERGKYSSLPSPICGISPVGRGSSSSFWWKRQPSFCWLSFFFSFKSQLVSWCCPALSLFSSFAWQKHVTFVVNVPDYYLVLVLKHYLVPRYYDLFWATDSSALHIFCQMSVHLIIKTEKAMWVDHSCFQGKSVNWWLRLFNFKKNIFSILWFI